MPAWESLIHTYTNQFSDDIWKRKGALHEAKRLLRHYRYQMKTDGCVLYSYETPIACVAWSSSLKTHVFIYAADVGWSKTTTRQIRALQWAIPSDKSSVAIYDFSLLEKVRGSYNCAIDADVLKKYAKDEYEAIINCLDNEHFNVNHADDRETCVYRIALLKKFIYTFGHHDSGISAKELKAMERLELLMREYRSKVKPKIVEEELVLQKYRKLNSIISYNKEVLKTLKSSKAVKYLVENYLKKAKCSKYDTHELLYGLLLATYNHPEIDKTTVAKIKRAQHIRDYILAHGIELTEKGNFVYKSKSFASIAALLGIPSKLPKGARPIINGSSFCKDTVVFSANTQSWVTARYAEVKAKDARAMLALYITDKDKLLYRRISSFRVNKVNNKEIIIGCHTFSGEYLRALHAFLQRADHLSEKDKALQEHCYNALKNDLTANTQQ